MDLHPLPLVIIIITIIISSSEWICVNAGGVFQAQILSYYNKRGELANGQCCQQQVTEPLTNKCSGSCNVTFALCLREHQTRVTYDGACTFGSAASGVFRGNRLSFSENDQRSLLELDLEFAWTRTFTMLLEMTHNGSSRWNSRNDTVFNSSSEVIEHVSYSSVLLPGDAWHVVTHPGPTAAIVYRVRVRCAPHYYNTTCTRLCRPRHDKFGHYNCNENGDKVCLEGWMGSNCEKAICRTGCHNEHGSCERPGECRCGYGWQGPLCDQCIPYPGCKHGFCKDSPWQCECHLNWGGILCDQDLNYCGRHSPCKNGGLCRNKAPNEYICECQLGFSGTNCDIVDDGCASDPCQNGATCALEKGRYVCACAEGWTGRQCDINADECASQPCQHGGSCVDLIGGYECLCQSQWQGPQCQLDADECQGGPCLNAYACRNMVGDYECMCLPGWEGKNCDSNINDCFDQCLNSATCVDMVEGFYCSCIEGFTGVLCEHEVNECISEPCLNGGQCHDLLNAFSCSCPAGYSGNQCETDIDLCEPNPCRNGASCFNLGEDYYCRCTDVYEGRNCSLKKDSCRNTLCQVVDSCTISLPSEDGGLQLVQSDVCGRHGSCLSQADGAFSCSCGVGFTGTYCHININDCAGDPCQNQGTCVDGVNSFQCMCPSGWEGTFCHINRNDCEPQPCRNGGTCTDHVTGFSCTCPAPWKGNLCHLVSSQCDDETCENGGTCTEVGGTFSCLCPPNWEGNTCHISVDNSCASNPCLHGGTCINSGNVAMCLCQDGYEGDRCERNTNNCNPFPCYNGGECVDGVNWYLCKCSQGFAGPDCRINLNECMSNPCAYGSTCVDGIGHYTCLCPAGRTGDHCDSVIGLTPAPKSCSFHQRLYANDDLWEHDCNRCVCKNGKVSCTQVWCGPPNCLQHSNMTEPSIACADGETCVLQHSSPSGCFNPPCLPRGVCMKRNRVGITRPPSSSNCQPNSPRLGSNCARVILIFDKHKMASGVTVEGLCNTLRNLPLTPPQGVASTLVLLCEPQYGRPDSIESAVATQSSNDSGAQLVQVAADSLTELISRQLTNNTALAAVIEVKLERAVISTTHTGLLVPIVCSLLGLIGLFSVLILLAWHSRQLRRAMSHQRLPSVHASSPNNEPRSPQIKRFRNSLYEERDIDVNMEKYETSPKKFQSLLLHKDIPPGVKKKNINVELQRIQFHEEEVG
ncbi:hypothetical protein CAPTEDRAFT_101809 [Capitella teleta]|uniref:Delta-like protein n=1 Tax=Capitella teleta TaxID=283909 RepID=R7UBK4_CAPTE|nr:hypothetical protein CAPTEDRAFT_101809 [Capitella teleta]|eukprot:ELU03755.1 hypothetical protein CAPTEDRAFT_101809 [Capitella teleta]